MNLSYGWLIALLVVLIFPAGCSQNSSMSGQGPESSVNAKIDPVCKMRVAPERAKGTHKHHDKQYYFCSEHCKEAFAKEPDKFLASK